MMSPAALLLAIITGIAFGAIVHWLWGWRPGTVAAVLLLLWFLQTFSQQLWRIFEGTGTVDESLIVGSYRLAFALAAISVAWALHDE